MKNYSNKMNLFPVIILCLSTVIFPACQTNTEDDAKIAECTGILEKG